MTTNKTIKDKAAAHKRAESKSAPEGPSRLEAFFAYFENSRKELGKVSWPTRKEIKATSLAVLALVAVMAVFLGLVDVVLSGAVQFILSMSS